MFLLRKKIVIIGIGFYLLQVTLELSKVRIFAYDLNLGRKIPVDITLPILGEHETLISHKGIIIVFIL